MSMVDLVVINLKTPRIDSRCFLDKEFTKLIYINPEIVLYLIANQDNLFHGSVYGRLT